MPNLFKTINKPILIAGPCSIESCEQLQSATTQLLEGGQISLIRGGVWKPRTRPGGFEGLGETALQWIAQIKNELPTARFCCEVAQPNHVELCLKYGIDAVWIGSRTTGNPFSVGELCAALKGSNLPVMVKNPLTPDVKLWLGAIERVQNAGIESIAAIHRGFYLYNNYGYRNSPLWEVTLELKHLTPDTPLLCDPSHIGGCRNLLQQIMQTALDLHFDGLMVEVHPHPDEALTDASQQLTPHDFFDILSQLTVRQNESAPDALKILRSQIDEVDNQLLQLLSDRLSIAQQIAHVKAQNNMTVFQPKRWEEVLNRKIQKAKELGLNTDFVKALYEKIHAESVNVQLSIPKNNKPSK